MPIANNIASLNPYHCEVYSVTTLRDKVCQWLATGQWFSLGTRFPPPIKLDMPQYNWNIVESGIKHHNPYPIVIFQVVLTSHVGLGHVPQTVMDPICAIVLLVWLVPTVKWFQVMRTDGRTPSSWCKTTTAFIKHWDMFNSFAVKLII